MEVDLISHWLEAETLGELPKNWFVVLWFKPWLERNGVSAAAVNRSDFEKFFKDMSAVGMTAHTLYTEEVRIRRLYRWAVAKRLIDKVPFDRNLVLSRPQSKPPSITKDEVFRIVEFHNGVALDEVESFNRRFSAGRVSLVLNLVYYLGYSTERLAEADESIFKILSGKGEESLTLPFSTAVENYKLLYSKLQNRTSNKIFVSHLLGGANLRGSVQFSLELKGAALSCGLPAPQRFTVAQVLRLHRSHFSRIVSSAEIGNLRHGHVPMRARTSSDWSISDIDSILSLHPRSGWHS